jgi:hypothetical protein
LVDLVAEARSAVGGRAVGGPSLAGLVAQLVGHGAGVADVLGAADAALSHVVSFAGDLRSVRNVGGCGGRAKLEDWGLPVVALQRELFVFSGLGRDATWKVDVWEDRVLLGDGHVDLCLTGAVCSLLCLLLALEDLLLDGLHIAVVDVLCVLGILQCLLLGAISLDLDLVGVRIKLVGLILDGLFNSLLESWAEGLQQDWLCKREQELMLGLCELDVEVLDVNLEDLIVSTHSVEVEMGATYINFVNLEEVLAIRLLSCGELHLEAEARTAKEDISNTEIGNARETLLSLDIV